MTESLEPLVLFLHGPGGGPSDFDAVVRRLPERFPTCAPELPWERGGSPRDLVSGLEEALRAGERPVVLVAGSRAAYVALELARRIRSRVRGVVLSGCSDDPRDGFGRTDVPALLLWGTDDAVTPPALGRRVREALPDARLLFVLEAGHLPMVESPAVYAFHLASFLNDLAPQRVPPRRLVDEAA